jgi:hypothetical protein
VPINPARRGQRNMKRGGLGLERSAAVFVDDARDLPVFVIT